MPISDAYDDHVDFIIEPVWEDDANEDVQSIDTIEFEYASPAFSVDTSGRFATHEIIGGTTVRQKIGEEPINVDISGVCFESTALKIDALRDAQYGTIYADRLVGDSLDVQFASSSTSPLDENGAVNIEPENSEFLHTYSLSVVEINIIDPRFGGESEETITEENIVEPGGRTVIQQNDLRET